MRTEMQVFCGEGIRRNRMDRLDFEASQELLKGGDDVTSELSDDSDGDREGKISEGKSSAASSAKTLENHIIRKTAKVLKKSLKTSIASSKRRSPSSVDTLMLEYKLEKAKIASIDNNAGCITL